MSYNKWKITEKRGILLGKKIAILFFTCILAFSTLFMPTEVEASSIMNTSVTKNLGASGVTVSLRSLQTGKVIYQRGGNTAMKPASTLKLLTGSAALATLGEDFRFKTDFYLNGTVDGSVLNGDLYIKGSGDPTLQKEDFLQFAKVLKREGIRTINGNIYGDDSAFSGSTLTPGIVSKEETYYFAARTSALTMSPNNDFDASTLIITTSPTKVGKAVSYAAVPNKSGMKVINQARTVSKGKKKTISIKRKYNSNEIVISGNLPIGSSAKEWVTFQNPTINTLYSLKTILEGTGLAFNSKTKVKQQPVPEQAKRVYTKNSRTLKALYPTFIKLSNNSIADILIKTMGHEVAGVGDTKTGLRVMRDYGNSLGLSMNKWSLEDGSGMSHQNRVSANEQTLLLLKMKNEGIYPTFYKGLPIGGIKSRLVGGTLRNRFSTTELSGRVVAKTGSITSVYTLAGYAKAKSGRTYAFSIMTNSKNSSAIKGIDNVVRSIISNY